MGRHGTTAPRRHGATAQRPRARKKSARDTKTRKRKKEKKEEMHKEYKWMTPAQVARIVPELAAHGVSEVARSARGFIPAYLAARTPERMARTQAPGKGVTWAHERHRFIKRTLAAYEMNPTHRRALALMAWAYVPRKGPWGRSASSASRGRSAPRGSSTQRGSMPSRPSRGSMPSRASRAHKTGGASRGSMPSRASMNSRASQSSRPSRASQPSRASRPSRPSRKR